MTASCTNPECRAILRPETRSKDNQKFCADCGDFVYAFRPDRELPDDWYLVSDGRQPEDGEAVDGGQCEGCALSQYVVVRQSRSAWDAVCKGQYADQSWVEGCGAAHPIRMKMRYTVILPWSEASPEGN